MTSHAITSSEFRAAAALFPTGVTVVTRSIAGRAYGMTVSSFTTVSLEPPLILVCIDNRAGFLSELQQQSFFAVNVLREDQQELAVRFSRKPEWERFDSVAWTESSHGTPTLDDAVAIFVCSLEQVVVAGDHQILIGMVQQILREGGQPLVWCGSDYHCLPRPLTSGLG